MEDLKTIVAGLIESKKEGTFWDFKETHHTNNADLLHDVLCLSNAQHNGDRYLIIGVCDPANSERTVDILSEGSESTAKNQQQYIDFLQSKKFAGSYRPQVELHNFQIDGKPIDVLVIKNRPFKPYYITQDYNCGNRKVRANYIYSRSGDTNTAMDRSADLPDIEDMWRERFGLNLPGIEKMLTFMSNPLQWEKNFGNSDIAYYRNSPEYHIKFGELRKFDTREAFCYFYPNPNAFLGNADFYINSTRLFSLEYMTCDEMRVYLPVPSISHVRDSEEEGWFFYYIKDEQRGVFLGFMTDLSYSFSSGRMEEPPFIIFNNKKEYNQFVAEVNKEMVNIKNIKPRAMATIAAMEKERDGNDNLIDPIFMDQIHQYYLSKNTLAVSGD